MFYSQQSIPNFLGISRVIIETVSKNDFVKSRIASYNYDETKITTIVDLYNKALQAESNKASEFGEQLEAKVFFDEIFEKAKKIFYKHKAFLTFSLANSPELLRKVLLVGPPRSQGIMDLLKHIVDVYDAILAEDSVLQILLIYNITAEELEDAKATAEEAIQKKAEHSIEQIEAQDATVLRDQAFEDFKIKINELVMICTYALEDRPQLLQKMGIIVRSPGYRSKKEDKEEKDDKKKSKKKEKPVEYESVSEIEPIPVDTKENQSENPVPGESEGEEA